LIYRGQAELARGVLLSTQEGKVMTLRDISNGPDWIPWAGVVLFAVISLILLSGHGANLIAGYNTASKEEKSKYNTKKLCRVYGSGMSVITVMLLIMTVFEAKLPAYFAVIFLVVTGVDCAIILILANTVCKTVNNESDNK